MTIGRPPTDIWKRIKRQSERTSNGCLVWQGSINSSGYGQIAPPNSKSKILHRVVWQMLFGPIPKGYQLHHTCENKRCWNPDHLELISPSRHKLLHNGDYCPNGHEFTKENTYLHPDGAGKYRECRLCRTAKRRAYRQRIR